MAFGAVNALNTIDSKLGRLLNTSIVHRSNCNLGSSIDFRLRNAIFLSLGRSAAELGPNSPTKQVERRHIRAAAVVPHADRRELRTVRHPEAALHPCVRKRSVLHLDFLQSRAVLDHHVHYTAAFAPVEHQRLHQPLQQHELPRETHVPRERDLGGAVEEERADFLPKERPAAANDLVGNDPVGAIVLRDEVLGKGPIVEVGAIGERPVELLLDESAAALAVDEDSLLVLFGEHFLEVFRLVDFRPAVELAVAEIRSHHLVLRDEETLAVRLIVFVDFAEPVVACVRFGDICLDVLHVDFVEWVDQKVDVVIDHGDA